MATKKSADGLATAATKAKTAAPKVADKVAAKVADKVAAKVAAVKAAATEQGGWRDQAEEFASQAKGAATNAAASAKNTTGEALHGLSKLIADTAETVDSKLGPQYGDYARKAAEAVSGAAKSLDDKDIDQLADDARNFVRKSPAVAIGAAAIVGFVLMRMMRGSDKDA